MKKRPTFFSHQTSGSISSEVPTSVARQSDHLHRHIIVRGDTRLTQRLIADCEDAEERRKCELRKTPKSTNAEI